MPVRRRWESKLLSLAREIIRQDSTNQRGTRSLAEFLGKELRTRGFQVSYQRVRQNGGLQANLIGHRSGTSERGLLINAHLDTVATDSRKWTSTGGDPFHPTLRKGRLYGLGSADTKAAWAAQLVALDALDLSRLRCPLWLTGTYGEEIGLVGVQRLIHDKSIRPAFILNTEPTELVPVRGNHGYCIFRLAGFQLRRTKLSGYVHRIHFKGRAAHSAVPSCGRNAIWEAWRWLRTHGKDAVVLNLKGGVAPNIIAADCWLEILSSEKRPRQLRSFGGNLLSSEYRTGRRACPELSACLWRLPQDLLSLNTRRETSNCGRVSYGLGQFEWTISYRYAPGIQDEGRFQLWKKQVRALTGGGVYLGLATVKRNAAFQQKANCRLVRQVRSVMQEMQRPTQLILRPGCTEAGHLAQLGGDVITIGPGEAYGNIHAPNESIRLKELSDAVIFYRKMIERICL